MGGRDNQGDSDEYPLHPVSVSPFWMARYEVTQSLYREIMGSDPAKRQGDDLPVESVSWKDAKKFCEKFGARYGVACRLPTEAEWEYASRADGDGIFAWGDSMDPAYCWFDPNAGGATKPVGTRKPNAWGLCDTIGNVWEWCEDWYSEKYYSVNVQKDPRGPKSGVFKVIRGGSWDDRFIVHLRPSYRYHKPADDREYTIGFRLVVEVE